MFVARSRVGRASVPQRSCIPAVAHALVGGGTPGGYPSSFQECRKMKRKSKGSGERSASSVPTDAVVIAVELQDFDGYWLLNKDLTRVFNSTLSQLTSSKPSDVNDTKMWATALVIAYLQTHMASRKEEWEMVVQKAMDWLKETCPNPEALLEKAKVALEKLLPKP